MKKDIKISINDINVQLFTYIEYLFNLLKNYNISIFFPSMEIKKLN